MFAPCERIIDASWPDRSVARALQLPHQPSDFVFPFGKTSTSLVSQPKSAIFFCRHGLGASPSPQNIFCRHGLARETRRRSYSTSSQWPFFITLQRNITAKDEHSNDVACS